MDHRTSNGSASPNGHHSAELAAADVGNMTHGLRDNAKDLYDLWMENPMRRNEFGAREVFDIREAVLGLSTLLREIDARSAPTLVYKR